MPRYMADATCTNCGKDHPVIFDMPRVVSPQEEKAKEPAPPKIMVPRHIPRYSCANGNCDRAGGLHDNDNYSLRPKKKCTKCDQFAPEYAKGCPWCGNEGEDWAEELDDDDLDDLGIPKPTGGHNHD